ncbi:hypothetical protein ACFX2A_046906 [Malus domestica]
MRFKCVHESWRDLIDSRFVASHLSNSNNSRSSARIAVRHIVGGEEDDKEDVLGEEVEEELDQWAEEMGESQAKAMKLNLHPLLEQRMEFTQRSAALPSSSQTVTRGRGQGRASGAMATSQDLPFRPSTLVIAKPGGRSKH